MRVRSLVLPVLSLVLAADLIRLGATRDGVGPFEYVTLTALVALLLVTAVRLSRRALGRS